MIRRGNTGAKDGKSREVKTYRLLCPIRSQCCTNYNAPTGALDEENSARIMDIFKQLNESGITLLIVTHDPGVAAKCKRTIWIKDGRNARMEE